MLSIVIDIMYHNPRNYPECSAIISQFINDNAFKEYKLDLFKKTQEKFKDLPNTEYLEIWLQRIAINVTPEKLDFASKICKKVQGEKVQEKEEVEKVFNSEGLKSLELIEDIVDRETIENLNEVIKPDEVFSGFEHYR